MATPEQDAMDALYESLPKLECKRLCQSACGVIMMSRLEWERIIERLGYPPQGNESLVCPMLSMFGACTVYDIRPAICRLYGLVKKLSCPHGCEPERWLTDAEARAFMQLVGKVGA